MSTATLPASGRMATYGWAASTPGVRALRLIIIVLLVPFAVYLVPRVLNLVHLTTGWELPIIRSYNPATLNEAKRAGYLYNPQLAQIAASEQETLAALGSLDQVAVALDKVRGDVASVDQELNILIGQVSGGLQTILNVAVATVQTLLTPIDALNGNLTSINNNTAGDNDAVDAARASITTLINSGASAAAGVSSARQSADAAANIVAPR